MSHGLSIYDASGNLTFTSEYGSIAAYSVVTIPAGQTIGYSQTSYPELAGATIGIYGDWPISMYCNPTIDYPNGVPRLTLNPSSPFSVSMDTTYVVFIISAPSSLQNDFGAIFSNAQGNMVMSSQFGPYVYAGAVTASEMANPAADPCSTYITSLGYSGRSMALFPKNGISAMPLFATDLPAWPNIAGISHAQTYVSDSNYWAVYLTSSVTATPTVYAFLPVSVLSQSPPTGSGMALYKNDGSLCFASSNHKPLALAAFLSNGSPLIRPIPQVHYPNYQSGSYPTINYSSQTYDPGVTLPTNVLTATQCPVFYGVTMQVRGSCFFGQKTNDVQCFRRFFGFGRDGNVLRLGYLDIAAPNASTYCSGSNKSIDGGWSTAQGSAQNPWGGYLLLIDKRCTQ